MNPAPGETAASMSPFRDAFRRHRCLMGADGVLRVEDRRLHQIAAKAKASSR